MDAVQADADQHDVHTSPRQSPSGGFNTILPAFVPCLPMSACKKGCAHPQTPTSHSAPDPREMCTHRHLLVTVHLSHLRFAQHCEQRTLSSSYTGIYTEENFKTEQPWWQQNMTGVHDTMTLYYVSCVLLFCAPGQEPLNYIPPLCQCF